MPDKNASAAVPSPKNPAVRSALVRMHAATVLFGISGIFGKLCQSSSFALVCGRALVAVGAVGILCLARQGAPWRGVRPQDLPGLLLSGVLLAVHFVTFFEGIKLGGVAVGTLGFASFPAFTALFESMAYRERPAARELTCMFFVSIGLVCIAPNFSFSHEATQGLLWGILAAVAYALVAISNRRFAASLTGMKTCWWQNIVIAACLLPLTIGEMPSISLPDWFWIACLGLLCTTLAYTLYVDSLAAIKARHAALIISLEPVYAVVAAWAFLNDMPTLHTLVGGSLILGAVFSLNAKAA